MTLGDVLAMGVGLAFTYALFSMFASVIKEAIAAKLQWRAKDLSAAIGAMLTTGGSANGPWGRLSERVYGHAMVSGISQNQMPSYLPARNFTLALLDELCAGSQAPVSTAVESAVESLPVGALRQRLKVCINDAAGDLDALKSNLDTWFDDNMDRLSGIYKRHAQLVLFLIGLALAIVLNVDTLKIVNVLQHNGQVRTEMADMSAAFQRAHADGAAPASTADIENAIASLPLPIGWTFCSSGDKTCEHLGDRWVQFGVVLSESKSWWAVVAELVGWLLTAVAISFGAPFWFDVMGQLINIRSVGPKPPRADAQTKVGPTQ